MHTAEELWQRVCHAYANQHNWRAGNDPVVAKAVADFEAAFAAPEKGIVVDLRTRRTRQ